MSGRQTGFRQMEYLTLGLVSAGLLAYLLGRLVRL